jgi:hypothetical protein
MVWTPPPNWPPPPSPGWAPPAGWTPDPGWGLPPAGWNFWPPRAVEPGFRGWVKCHRGLSFALALIAALLVVGIIGGAAGSKNKTNSAANSQGPIQPQTSGAPALTASPTPSAPTPTLPSLQAALLAKLGKSNLTPVQPRIIKLRYTHHVLEVPFLAQDNITQGLRSDGAKQDVDNMLQIVRAHPLPGMKEVDFFGFFPETDSLGNLKVQQVILVDYTRKRLDAINFGGLPFTDIYGAANDNLSTPSWH